MSLPRTRAIRLAHLADVHLGCRQYGRANAHGVNQREADIALTFRSAIDAVLAARPHALLIAGDLFHSPRPGNIAIVEAHRQLVRCREAGIPVLLIAGNHDTPKSVDTGTLFPLFADIGLVVAWQDARRWQHPTCGLSVTLAPHAAVLHGAALEPDPAAAVNVLLIHAAVVGMPRAPGYEVAPAAPLAQPGSSWDYVALGDYHVARQVAPNAWYAGSLDCCSTNPWGELREAAAAALPAPKGWLLVTLDEGHAPLVEFQPLAPSRPFLDLPPIDVSDDPDAVNAALTAVLPVDVAGKVVRQVVHGLSRPSRHQIDYAHVRALQARALRFALDVRPLPRRAPQPVDVWPLGCAQCGARAEVEGDCADCGACLYCDGKGCPRCAGREPVPAACVDPDSPYLEQVTRVLMDYLADPTTYRSPYDGH